jgi:hypothetical protein
MYGVLDVGNKVFFESDVGIFMTTALTFYRPFIS